MTTREISPQSAEPLPAHLGDATADETSLRRFLLGLPGVDPVGIEQRAAGLATRSIKRASKLAAIDLAISMVDLTTLEGADTPGRCAISRVRRCCPIRTIRDPAHGGHLRLSRHGAHRRFGAERLQTSRSRRSPQLSRPAARASR